MECGNIMFNNGTKQVGERLEKLQTEAIHIVCGNKKGTSKECLLRELGWLTLSKGWFRAKLFKMFSICKKLHLFISVNNSMSIIFMEV